MRRYLSLALLLGLGLGLGAGLDGRSAAYAQPGFEVPSSTYGQAGQPLQGYGVVPSSGSYGAAVGAGGYSAGAGYGAVQGATPGVAPAYGAAYGATPGYGQLGQGLAAQAPGAFDPFLGLPGAVAVPVPDPQQEELARLDGRLRALDAELDALRTQHERSARNVTQRGRALYRIRRAGMLPLGGGFEAMLSHLARVERLERLVVHSMDHQAELGRRLGAVEAERVEIAQSRAALAAQIRGHAAEVAAAPSPFEEVLAQPSAPRAPDLGYGLRVHGAPNVGFASQRGRLALPVRSAGDIRDAQREDGEGLEFAAPARASVQAVAEGHVAYAERYGDYGNMVIIDHGNRYFTVYSSLGELEVRRGEWVGPGYSLGWSGGEPVYFEVRRGTRSLPSRRWLGL